MPWSSEEVRTLIAEYKKRPCLWNAYLQDYKDRIKKVDSWNQLANIFNKDKIEVEKKIHALRVQFSEEVRKYEKKRSESGLNEPPKSSWQYFDSLRFIQAGAKRRKRASHTQYVTSSSSPATEILPNLPSETDAYAVSPITSTSYTHDSTSVAIRNEHKMAIFDPKSQEQILEKTLDIISRPSETDTEYNTFGTHSASELQEHESDEAKKRLKSIILSALIRASKENKAGDEDEMAYQRDEELFQQHTQQQQQQPPPEIPDDFHQASTSFKKVIKKRKPSDEHQYMDSPMDFVQTSTTASNDARDEFSIFADYVASELRTIGDRRALAVAKHNINTVLFEATTGMYDQQIANGHD